MNYMIDDASLHNKYIFLPNMISFHNQYIPNKGVVQVISHHVNTICFNTLEQAEGYLHENDMWECGILYKSDDDGFLRAPQF